MRILVTGAAGFIGFHLCKRLLKQGFMVLGLDNLNDYYSPKLKQDRLKLLEHQNFSFKHLDLAQMPALQAVCREFAPSHVVNLAAQAGVRYSLENPAAYVQTNLVGFANLLECCRELQVKHLLFASSSSVYGLNTKLPFAVEDNVDHPISLYAATKKSNELMAHSYSHLFRIPCTGLRFFTVYGPWGRPDMALFLFTKAILNHEPIKVFNQGQMRRDFTYIDDIIEGVYRLLDHLPQPDPNFDTQPSPGRSSAPWRIYNIGNNQCVQLTEFIATLEEALGQKALVQLLPMQAGDVEATYANIDALTAAIEFKPSMPLKQGIENFVNWYKDYYKLAGTK